MRSKITSKLFTELCSYIDNTKYGNGYEFNFQLWNAFYAIFIHKDDVELKSFSGDTPEEAMLQALKWLQEIKAVKPNAEAKRKELILKIQKSSDKAADY